MPKPLHQMATTMVSSSSMAPMHMTTSQARTSSAGPPSGHHSGGPPGGPPGCPPGPSNIHQIMSGMPHPHSGSQPVHRHPTPHDLRCREPERPREPQMRTPSQASPVPSHYGHLPQHSVKDRRELQQSTDAKDLSHRLKEEHYRGDPRDYDPLDPLFHETHRKIKDDIGGPIMTNPLAPPPAHSNHPKQQHTDNNALYQLAKAATEQHPLEVHRPHSEPRSRSPFYTDRLQETPPALHPSSPYAYPPGADRQIRQVPKSTIGQPPPLITVKDTKPPGISQKDKTSVSIMMPAHPGGSITQGTPAISQPPSTMTGSISMGTPRYDSQQNRQTTPPHSRGDGQGSITKGTPVMFEGGVGRGTPVTMESGNPRPQMMLDPATVAALGRGAMIYTDPGGVRMPLICNPADMEMMRRLPPNMFPGLTLPGNFDHSSSAATLMDDFMTAKMMQQEAQRRIQPESEQPSPRQDTGNPRDPTAAKPPYPPGMMGAPHVAMPYPMAPRIVYLPPQLAQGSVPQNERPAPMNSRDVTPPRASEPGPPSSSWQHTPGQTSMHSPHIPSGSQQVRPQDRGHPTPPPGRTNVIHPPNERNHGVIREPPRGVARPSSAGQKQQQSSPYPSPVDRRIELEFREQERERERWEAERDRRKYLDECAMVERRFQQGGNEPGNSRPTDRSVMDRPDQMPSGQSRPVAGPVHGPGSGPGLVPVSGSIPAQHIMNHRSDPPQNVAMHHPISNKRTEDLERRGPLGSPRDIELLKRHTPVMGENNQTVDIAGREENGDSGDGTGGPSTFTAAVLIDLIITNQINQQKTKDAKAAPQRPQLPALIGTEKKAPITTPSPQQQIQSSSAPTVVSSSSMTEPTESSSQHYIYGQLQKAVEADRANGNAMANQVSSTLTSAGDSLVGSSSAEHNSKPNSLPGLAVPGQKTITLGQHIDAIITQDFQGTALPTNNGPITSKWVLFMHQLAYYYKQSLIESLIIN